MKAEINNENKEKFFALYWGQLIGLGLNDQLDMNRSKFKAQSAFTERIELKSVINMPDEEEEFIIESMKNFQRNADFEIALGIDYLRSKGYALPWMGLTVEEIAHAGWIKLV